jgi:hypothetical protein
MALEVQLIRAITCRAPGASRGAPVTRLVMPPCSSALSAADCYADVGDVMETLDALCARCQEQWATLCTCTTNRHVEVLGPPSCKSRVRRCTCSSNASTRPK